MHDIAFVDTETTHLDAEIGEAWEVAVILREDNDPTTDTEYVWEFSIDPEAADPEALRIGRWHDRRQLPARTDQAAFTGSVPALPMTRAEAVRAITSVLSGAVLVGSNPGFDDRFLRKLLGPGSAQWHYRPYDVVQLAAAKIGAQQAGPLPWSSYALSRAVGVEPPAKDVAHTALGDARWARDVYDAATTRQPYELTMEGRAQHAVGLYVETAIELEDARRANAELTHDAERFKQDHLSACGTIAEMHAAATGRTGLGPIRGVVEDVADVRERADKVARGLHIYVHALRGRPGREISTEYALHCLTQLIAHPERVCALDWTAAALDRVRSLAEAAQAPGTDGQPSDVDTLWPSAVLAALDGLSTPVVTANFHFGRSWSGHDLEDACPCTKAPCGLVSEVAVECTEHNANKSTRQSHPADACPGPA